MAGEDPKREWWRPTERTLHGLRDGILFVGGLVGLYHETFVVPSADPQLLILFAAMVGLPAFIRGDKQ